MSNKTEPLEPDPKHDGIEAVLMASHYIKVQGIEIEMWENEHGDEFVTVNGKPAKYGYFETIEKIRVGIK